MCRQPGRRRVQDSVQQQTNRTPAVCPWRGWHEHAHCTRMRGCCCWWQGAAPGGRSEFRFPGAGGSKSSSGRQRQQQQGGVARPSLPFQHQPGGSGSGAAAAGAGQGKGNAKKDKALRRARKEDKATEKVARCVLLEFNSCVRVFVCV